MFVLIDQAAEDGSAPDSFRREVGDRVVGSGWSKLERAVGAPSVVVGLVPGKDRPQVPLAEDQ